MNSYVSIEIAKGGYCWCIDFVSEGVCIDMDCDEIYTTKKGAIRGCKKWLKKIDLKAVWEHNGEAFN